jgi:hypothetical protein
MNHYRTPYLHPNLAGQEMKAYQLAARPLPKTEGGGEKWRVGADGKRVWVRKSITKPVEWEQTGCLQSIGTRFIFVSHVCYLRGFFFVRHRHYRVFCILFSDAAISSSDYTASMIRWLMNNERKEYGRNRSYENVKLLSRVWCISYSEWSETVKCIIVLNSALA